MRHVILMALVMIGSASAAGAADKSRPARPEESPLAWFTTEDYPAEAVAAHAEGATSITYDIDANGRVGFCTVTQSSGSVALDEASCRIMKERGRFTPALDAKGRPVTSQDKRRVTWAFPKTVPIKNASSRVVRVMDVDEEGIVTNCTVTEAVNGGVEIRGNEREVLCHGMAEAFRSRQGMVDDQGKPTKVRLEFTTEVKVLPSTAGK